MHFWSRKNLARNFSKGNNPRYIEKARHGYRTDFKHGPLVFVGDFNVDIMAVEVYFLVSQMICAYGLWCCSYDGKHPKAIRAHDGANPTVLKSYIMPYKAKLNVLAQDTSRIVEQLTTLLERQATRADSFRLPLAVLTYEGYTDKK
ncbi:hypothetical protein MRX96_042592 [Rhipicephalus microplus]